MAGPTGGSDRQVDFCLSLSPGYGRPLLLPAAPIRNQAGRPPSSRCEGGWGLCWVRQETLGIGETPCKAGQLGLVSRARLYRRGAGDGQTAAQGKGSQPGFPFLALTLALPSPQSPSAQGSRRGDTHEALWVLYRK